MKIDRLITLLPCDRLEDLRLDRYPDEAEELLSAWSALWHPALIDNAQNVPNWSPANQPPENPTDCLIVLPECCQPLLPDGWMADAEASGAMIIKNLKNRSEMVGAALKLLGDAPPAIEPTLAADFLALGFCRFIVELLTLKLRYMSNINEDVLRTAVLAAAKAAVQGEVDTARNQLQSAFDRLHEAREYFYPVEAYLIDLTLAAPTTLGESLGKELSATLPRNLLISGEVLQEMARREPATLVALKEAIKNRSVSIVGGEFTEVPLPLLIPNTIGFHLQRGLEIYRKYLNLRPEVFGRRRFGLNLALPQILVNTGFNAAVHVTLDDGQFPTANQSCIRWEGFDGTAIDALNRIPLDANRADSFFSLPEKLGNAMEMDHPPTVVFAHWPGAVCPWYDDLRRIFTYSRVLGGFCTLDDYFQQNSMSGQQLKFNADQYRLPYLVQDVAANRADTISRWIRFYRRQAVFESVQTLNTLAVLASKMPLSDAVVSFDSNLKTIRTSLDDSLNPDSPALSELDRLLQQALDDAVKNIAQSLSSKDSIPHKPNTETLHGEFLPPSSGYLLVNPCSFSQRLGFYLPELGRAPEVADPIRATDENKAVVDLPGMGFAWIGPTGKNQSSSAAGEKKGWFFGKKHKSQPPLAEENLLRNEFFEVIFDPHTGAIRAISDYRSRHPRLAQQIALRMPGDGKQDSDGDGIYSIMSADEIRITSTGPVCGEIVASGKITDREGHRLAGFRQTTRAWRGSRVLELEIELDLDRQPGPNPWNSYYACRFAWGDETCNIYRSVNLTTQPTNLDRFESPLFVDIRHAKLSTTVLCNGLPYHRRIGLRKLDTLLIVQGETARSFRLGVGIDLPNAMTAALGFLAPRTACYPSASPPSKHGWLFHLDHRNVIATRWEPIWMSEELEAGVEGQGERVIGFRVSLLETDGNHTQLGLRSFRPITSARKLASSDNSPVELPIEGDRINASICPYQSLVVEAMFT